ncbi:hypothetical protein A3860_08640 [Niastella vici]|uniref:Uncharacterized protein n=1 Tax=Niastella vici TaxID=1703345 RepID=A0A1V9FH33_9BACT|nr:hypothetical protein [Niastella vici]OQP57689.1 hypothetical protein A3860_08640 [Niastella vici]
MKNILLIPIFLISCIAAAAQTNIGDPFATDEDKIHAILQNFCTNAWPKYKEIDNWIKAHKTLPPEVPVPPAVDPFCYDCSAPKGKDQSEEKVDAFVAKSMQPEADMIKTLLAITRAWTMLGGKDGYPAEEYDRLPECMKKLSGQDMLGKVTWLVERVYEDKALKMAKQYKTHPEMEYAGVKFLLACTRGYALITGGSVNDSRPMTYASDWLQTYFDKYEERLTKQYQYNLFPAFIYLPRQIALMHGGEGPSIENLQKWMTKVTDFMHFKLKVDFEAQGHDDNGGKYHALAIGETTIQCKLQEGGCYVWEPVDGNNMEFKVVDVVFTSDQGVAVYKSPQTFSAPVSITVNMCDDNPVFKIAFSKFGGDNETYTASDGSDFNAPMLNSLAMATLGSVNMAKMQVQAQNMQSKAAQFSGKEAQVDAAAKRLREHGNDPGYMQTAQGKADMDMMRQMAKGMGYDPNNIRPDPARMKNLDNLHKANEAMKKRDAKMTQPGYLGSEEYYKDQANIQQLQGNVNMNAITNAAGLNMNMLTIEAPFKIGVKQVVDKIQKDKIDQIAGSKGGWEFGQFHVTLENIVAQ